MFYRQTLETSTDIEEKFSQPDRHSNILLSPQVQNTIRNKLGLTEFQLKKILSNNLEFKLPEYGNSQLITLEYVDAPTEKEAIAMLEVFMTAIIEESRRINAEQLVSRIATLETRLATTQQELTTAEKSLYRFLSGDEGTTLLTMQNGSLLTEITVSQQQQRELQISLEKLQGQIDSLVKRLGLNPEQAYTAAALSADPILVNLRTEMLEFESEIKLREKDLRRDHPTMINLHKKLTAKEKIAQQRANEVLGDNGSYNSHPSKLRQEISLDPARRELAKNLVSLQTEKEGILRQLTALRQTEKKLQSQYAEYPDHQIQETRLSQELENKKVLYENIVTALVTARAEEAEITSNYAIAQSPIVEEVNSINIASNNRYLILLTGGGVGLVSAAGMLLLLTTSSDKSWLTAREIKELLIAKNLPLLGNIPFVRCFDLEGKESAIIADPNSEFINFYQKVWLNLRRQTNNHIKIVAVTSIEAREGKTLTAYNLAIAAANAGKRTLIIEADLRSPSHSHLVKVAADHQAKTEPFKYLSQYQETIRPVPIITNLYLLPSPGQLYQAPAILESQEFKRLMEDAKERFDFVVIDTPALAKFNDVLLLESFIDGIVLVNKPGIAKATTIEETLDSFIESNISLLGVVINNPQEAI